MDPPPDRNRFEAPLDCKTGRARLAPSALASAPAGAASHCAIPAAAVDAARIDATTGKTGNWTVQYVYLPQMAPFSLLRALLRDKVEALGGSYGADVEFHFVHALGDAPHDSSSKLLKYLVGHQDVVKGCNYEFA